MLNTRQAIHYARCGINFRLYIFGHTLIYCHKSTPSGKSFYEPALCASVFVRYVLENKHYTVRLTFKYY